jgi:hypothetical protein
LPDGQIFGQITLNRPQKMLLFTKVAKKTPENIFDNKIEGKPIYFMNFLQLLKLNKVNK